MEREPFRESDLAAGDLSQEFPLRRPRYRFAVRLTPPAPRSRVLEHRIEVIHPDEPERFGTSIHDRAEYTTGSTDSAVAHHHRSACYGIAHLMVVADELHRERPGLAVDIYTYDEPGHLDLVPVS